jgi:hypothetical protein
VTWRGVSGVSGVQWPCDRSKCCGSFGLVVGSREWKLQPVCRDGRRGGRPEEPPASGKRSSAGSSQGDKEEGCSIQNAYNFLFVEEKIALVLFFKKKAVEWGLGDHILNPVELWSWKNDSCEIWASHAMPRFSLMEIWQPEIGRASMHEILFSDE